MQSHTIFPENITDFLIWVRETTESAWSRISPDNYLYKAKWLPLSDYEINDLERRYSIQFGPEHRAFLRILHTIDKKDPDYYEGVEDADEGSDIKTKKQPSLFYNWHTDKEWIESRLTWPYETILQDILGVNRFWLKSWGPRAETEEEETKVFSAWYNKAPKLLPITAYTFLMNHELTGLRAVLSVWGSDTIVAGWNLRHYLMRKFPQELNIQEMVYDDEDKCYYGEVVKGIPELDTLETIRLADADIPHWKDIITHWASSQWQGFRVD